MRLFYVTISLHSHTHMHLMKTKKKSYESMPLLFSLSLSFFLLLMPKKHDGIESMVMCFSFSYCDVLFFSDMCVSKEKRRCQWMINYSFLLRQISFSKRTADSIVDRLTMYFVCFLLTFLLFLGFTCATENHWKRKINNKTSIENCITVQKTIELIGMKMRRKRKSNHKNSPS